MCSSKRSLIIVVLVLVFVIGTVNCTSPVSNGDCAAVKADLDMANAELGELRAEMDETRAKLNEARAELIEAKLL